MVIGFREDNHAIMFLADHYIQKDILFAFLDTDRGFDVQPRDIADIIKMSDDVDENMKIQIVNNCCLEQIPISLNVNTQINPEKLE